MGSASDSAGHLGRVQRVDAPQTNLVTFEVYRREGDDAQRFTVAFSAEGRGGVVRLESRPRGLPADSFVRRLRKLLVGAHTWAERGPHGAARLRFETKSTSAYLEAEAGAPILRRQDGHPMAARRKIAARDPSPGPWEAFALTAPEASTPAMTRPEPPRIRVLQRALTKHRKRLLRKRDAIVRDAARAVEAPALRARAQGLLAHAHLWRRGESEMEIPDFGSSPAGTTVVAVDPREGPAPAADRLFHRAKRLERGEASSAARLVGVAAELTRVEELVEALGGDLEDPTLAQLELRVRALGPQLAQSLGDASSARRRAPSKRLPYRVFRLGGRAVLVGRSARENDVLTLNHAKPHDLWLHARGVPGAHVVVPLGKQETCPHELLLDAATLAAHFSEAPEGETVEVQHTDRRHVRKPRGAAPGAVFVRNERVLFLRPDAERARRVLASEAAADGNSDRTPLR